MKKRMTLAALAAFTSALVFSGPALAEDVKMETVVKELSNPCGVAVEPGTGMIFVSDSGAGRVIKFDPKKPAKTMTVIEGYGKDIYGKGPMYDIGPLGLAFLNKGVLAVGGGSEKDGSEVVKIFRLSGDKAVKADAAKHTLGPIGPGEASKMGEGNFYGVAATPTGIYLTCNGDDTKGWISMIPLQDNEPGELTPFIASKVATEVDAPVGIAIAKDGNLVVSQMGEINVPNDCLLTVYDTSGKLLMKARTELHDIAGLAYSPKSHKLYAVDFAWMDTKQGGLFRLDVSDDGASVTAVKIAALEKPTAIAFGDDGSAYVTVIGEGPSTADSKPGAVIKITGDL